MFGLFHHWLTVRRRRAILAQEPPAFWEEWLPEAVTWYAGWPRNLQTKLVRNMQIFIAEKRWEGCNGLTVNDEMKFLIAAQAALMLTGVDDYCFEGITTILLYPRQFRRKANDGLLEWYEWRSGEAWEQGPIVLAWDDLMEGLTEHQNLVIHELAHHIDGLNGSMSGQPWFPDRTTQEQWERVSRAGLRQLRSDIDAGRDTFLDPYAATSRAEYFAVASETFFEMPRDLRAIHPDLYRMLTVIYRVDPAGWR